ncbi:hypothetical protein [Stenotrophomonas tumulicola]|uniref:Lipoprotein n=1 Tax=Stenotrophomonas tumulicola TaxID=1685415 RepID=A0A7W3FIP7_9GAMM|nr:hypothetical protein [Stenotrophomonas tumulicola]MBA8680205.1 hypothetical protein [Stenotrophomonas tumulicola]
MMRFNWIVFALVFAATLAGCSNEPAETDSGQSTGRQQMGASAAGKAQAPSSSSQSHLTPKHYLSASPTALASRLCVGECQRPGPLEAKTTEEAEWLIRHRYPTAAELEIMRTQSLDVLKQETSAGNTAAAAVLGKRISLERNFLDGQVILRDQALSGNIYAFYAISESYREAKSPNLIDSAAYLRVAYILGDHKAATELARMGLTSAELAAADSRASQLYKGFAGDQVPDPRPQE